MLLRKRAAISAKSSSVRKVKRKRVSSSSHDSGIATTDPSAQNATRSPLFHLPAELRNAIWELVYGHMLISIRFTCLHRIRYYPFSLSDRDGYKQKEDKSARLPGFVCKQFWAEVSGILMSSFTLRIDDPNIFQAFVMSGSPLIPRVRRLFLILQAYCPDIFALEWANTLTPSIVGRLESLQGLRLKLQMQNDPLESWHMIDIMDDRKRENSKLMEITRTFQQHKLHEAITSVHIDLWVEAASRCSYLSRLCEVIRENLLQYELRADDQDA